MPELPEVRVASSYINKVIKGKVIKDIVINNPKLIKNCSVAFFKTKLINSQIEKVTNKGKFIVFKFTNGLILLSHLRMEGKYRVKKDETFKAHDHLIFKFATFNLIYNDVRQFGTFHMKTKTTYLTTNPLVKMADIPSKINPNELYKKLSKRRIAIKSALLNQTLISGLGNIYANEVLWEVKVDPRQPSNQISIIKLKEIILISQKIMNKSTELGGTTIRSYLSFNKKSGGYQKFLKVHDKKGQKCERCQNIIEKIKLNGRGTYYCPHCQT